MTIKELNSLYWLNKEIENYRHELEELTEMARYTEEDNLGMPKGNSLSDSTANTAIRIADLQVQLQASLSLALLEQKRIEEYISHIEDADIRLIFRLRHISCYTWEQIGRAIHYTKSGVYQKYKRYLESVNKLNKEM